MFSRTLILKNSYGLPKIMDNQLNNNESQEKCDYCGTIDERGFHTLTIYNDMNLYPIVYNVCRGDCCMKMGIGYFINLILQERGKVEEKYLFGLLDSYFKECCFEIELSDKLIEEVVNNMILSYMIIKEFRGDKVFLYPYTN